jgi:hypothetical protein
MYVTPTPADDVPRSTQQLVPGWGGVPTNQTKGKTMNVSHHYDYQGDAEGLRKALIEIIEERRELVPRNQDTKRVQAQCDGERDAYNQVLNILHALRVTP